MFLAKFAAAQGPVIGIGLRPEDLQRLVDGQPFSFALRDAGLTGEDQDERVLVHFATPIQLEQMRHGYYPGVTDARIVLFIDHARAEHIRAGRPLDIRIQDAPVNHFVVFQGSQPADAAEAFRQLGLFAAHQSVQQQIRRPSSDGHGRSQRLQRMTPMMGPNAPGNFALS